MAILSRGILVSTTPTAGGGDGGPVAWTDVTSKPTTFPSSWATIADKPVILTEEDLAPIALSGSVDDIIDLPFPVTPGTPGQVLTSDAEGDIVWSDAPAGGITALEDDLAPKLGGDLDAGGHDINLWNETDGAGTVNIGRGTITFGAPEDGIGVIGWTEIGSTGVYQIFTSAPTRIETLTSNTVSTSNITASPDSSTLLFQSLETGGSVQATAESLIHLQAPLTAINGLVYPAAPGVDGQILVQAEVSGLPTLTWADAPTGGGSEGSLATLTTTTATPSEILRLPVPADEAVAINLLVSSYGSDIGYSADIFLSAKNIGGNASLVGQASSASTYDAGGDSRAVTYGVDGADLVVYVTGEEGFAVDWVIRSANFAPNLVAPVLNSYRVPFAVATVASGAVTLDCNTANAFEVTLTEDVTGITITNAVETQLVLVLRQDGTGGRTVAGWPANVLWPGGTAPTVTATADAVDMIVLVYNGTLDVWLANVSQDYK